MECVEMVDVCLWGRALVLWQQLFILTEVTDITILQCLQVRDRRLWQGLSMSTWSCERSFDCLKRMQIKGTDPKTDYWESKQSQWSGLMGLQRFKLTVWMFPVLFCRICPFPVFVTFLPFFCVYLHFTCSLVLVYICIVPCVTYVYLCCFVRPVCIFLSVLISWS